MKVFFHDFLFSLFYRYSSKAARGRPYSCKLSKGPAQCRMFTDLNNCVFPILFNLGPYLSFDPILMAKVIRVGRAFLKEVCTCINALSPFNDLCNVFFLLSDFKKWMSYKCFVVIFSFTSYGALYVTMSNSIYDLVYFK